MKAALNNIDQDAAWSMLQFIPADDRETWIKVGMALESEFGDAGFSLFDEWSQGADNYNPRAASSVWRSFTSGTISIGSLVHLAKGNGWRSDSKSKALLPKPRKVPQESQNNTKAYALRLWMAANSNDSFVAAHPYSIKKGIIHAAGAGRGVASGSLIGKNCDCIIVPIRNIDTNRVQGTQCINLEGVKQTFGSVSGGSLLLGNTFNMDIPWYVAEGWASAVSMVFHHHKGNAACAASFGKSNQIKVAEKIAEVYRPTEIIVLQEQD